GFCRGPFFSAVLPRTSRRKNSKPRQTSATGVRAGWRRSLFLCRQLRCCQSSAVEDVALADLQLVEPEVSERLAGDDCAAHDYRCAIRMEWPHRTSPFERDRC